MRRHRRPGRHAIETRKAEHLGMTVPPTIHVTSGRKASARHFSGCSASHTPGLHTVLRNRMEPGGALAEHVIGA